MLRTIFFFCMRWTGAPSRGVGGVNDSYLLSTTETENKHQPFMPSWHGEDLTLTNFISETCFLALI